MIRRKLLAVLLSFGLVFSNVLFVNASETQKLVDTKVETNKDVYIDLTKEEAEAKGYVLINKTVEEITHSEEYTLAEVYTSEEEAWKDTI